MTRDEAIKRIQALRPDLAQFDVKSLSLFGSIVRGEGTETSDIDLMVEFNGRATFDKYFGLLVFLEDNLGLEVDLVQPDTIRHQIWERVFVEAIRVA